MSSDDDSGAESSASSLNPNKRVKSTPQSVDVNRTILDTRNRSRIDAGKFRFTHGADLIRRAAGKKYLNVFEGAEPVEIELQYPSDSQRER